MPEAMATFAAWHWSEKLWLNVYTRTVSALLATAVVAVLATGGGLVDPEGLLWVCVPLLVAVGGAGIAGAVASLSSRVPRYRRQAKGYVAVAVAAFSSAGAGVWAVYFA